MTNTFNGYTYSGEQVIFNCRGEIKVDSDKPELLNDSSLYFEPIYSDDLSGFYTNRKSLKISDNNFVVALSKYSPSYQIEIRNYSMGTDSNCFSSVSKNTTTVPSTNTVDSNNGWDVFSVNENELRVVEMDNLYCSGYTVSWDGSTLVSGLTFVQSISSTSDSFKGLKLFGFGNTNLSFELITHGTGTTFLSTFGKITNWGASPTITFVQSPYYDSNVITNHSSGKGFGDKIMKNVILGATGEQKIMVFDPSDNSITISSTSTTVSPADAGGSYTNRNIRFLPPNDNNVIFGYYSSYNVTTRENWILTYTGGTTFTQHKIWSDSYPTNFLIQGNIMKINNGNIIEFGDSPNATNTVSFDGFLSGSTHLDYYKLVGSLNELYDYGNTLSIRTYNDLENKYSNNYYGFINGEINFHIFNYVNK